MKAQCVKARGRNQERQLLDQLQRIQQQVRGAVGPRMRQLEHDLPARFRHRQFFRSPLG